MKKLITLALSSLLIFALVGCSSAPESTETASAETVTIQALDAEDNVVDVEVPFDPQRIAVLDMAALDIIDALGLGDRVVGSADTTIDYLQDYVPNEENQIANLGTIQVADLVEVAACEPDVIFIGGRLRSVYQDLAEIAPVVFLATDSELGVYESTIKNTTTIASIFGMEDTVEELKNQYDFDERISTIKSTMEGTPAIVGIYAGSGYNILGDDGRCSLIGRELGFDNIGNEEAASGTSTHGNEASWETIVQLNPEYMFVVDKNTAIGQSTNSIEAKTAIENDLIKGTDVYKNGNIIYLNHHNIWYTAEGGLQALDLMIQDIEDAVL